jgi:hypothetical protein
MEITKCKGITTITAPGDFVITIYPTDEAPIEVEPTNTLSYLTPAEAEDLAAALMEAARLAREGEEVSE